MKPRHIPQKSVLYSAYFAATLITDQVDIGGARLAHASYTGVMSTITHETYLVYYHSIFDEIN